MGLLRIIPTQHRVGSADSRGYCSPLAHDKTLINDVSFFLVRTLLFFAVQELHLWERGAAVVGTGCGAGRAVDGSAGGGHDGEEA